MRWSMQLAVDGGDELLTRESGGDDVALPDVSVLVLALVLALVSLDVHVDPIFRAFAFRSKLRSAVRNRTS